MNPDEFEKHLQRQPLRQVPSEWRAEILQAATSARPSSLDPLARRSGAKAARPSLLSTILWPNAKAWAGLGCVWILIFALHIASRGNSPMLAQVSAPESANMMITLKDREQTLVELMGNNSPAKDADKPRRLDPQPRSERPGTTAMA
ncbi:MAG TPA: hypothetical protein VH597_14195 [Verrucomicrobiae bacterium]|jgi:hypothetical protein|nr:hypothetical protein [Verrucomicrobiae bacterium]